MRQLQCLFGCRRQLRLDLRHPRARPFELCPQFHLLLSLGGQLALQPDDDNAQLARGLAKVADVVKPVVDLAHRPAHHLVDRFVQLELLPQLGGLLLRLLICVFLSLLIDITLINIGSEWKSGLVEE